MESIRAVDQLFQFDIVDFKYLIHNLIGKGSFGEVYRASIIEEDHCYYALKIEKKAKAGKLLKEIKLLEFFAEKNCIYIPKLISYGNHDQLNYMVMELLGPNLNDLRRKQPAFTFDIKTTMAIGIYMLRAIREIHNCGIVHRDLKPSNFVITNSYDSRKIVLVDFGLSKSYINKNKDIKRNKEVRGGVGSKRYQSPYCHLYKHYGRRDDLWAFFYILIELYKGRLPWGEQNKEKLCEIKLKFMDSALTNKLPHQFSQILAHIKTLRYSDKPDYNYIFECMRSLYLSDGGDENFLFPWEHALSSSSSGQELCSDNMFMDTDTDSDSSSLSFHESNHDEKLNNNKIRYHKCIIQ